MMAGHRGPDYRCVYIIAVLYSSYDIFVLYITPKLYIVKKNHQCSPHTC